MSDSLPSSRPQRFFFVPLAVLAIVFGSSFLVRSKTSPVRALSADVMQLREHITGYAQNFVGIRYRHAGSTPKTGFDCSGFTSYILNEFDVKVSPSSLMQAMQGDKISLDEVLPGDLIFFGRRGRVSHVAMVVECAAEGIICVHSTCSRGVIVENISTSKYWKPKIMFARDVINRFALN